MPKKTLLPQPYDLMWLVRLAEAQHPDKPWLAEVLAVCTTTLSVKREVIYFVDSTHANQPGAEWQFDHLIRLKDATVGWLNVDVLTGPRVGGVEFYTRLFRRR